ncbi:MAG: hypothetical protein HPY52_03520 [Firmicutes bacterium]|nr:hypothetical protein [Bacillota bacterium]
MTDANFAINSGGLVAPLKLLKAILDVVLRSAGSLMGASRGVLLLIRGDYSFNIAASFGIDQKVISGFAADIDEGLRSAMLRLFRVGSPSPLRAVPLIDGGRVVGVFVLAGGKELRPKDGDEPALAAFADCMMFILKEMTKIRTSSQTLALLSPERPIENPIGMQEEFPLELERSAPTGYNGQGIPELDYVSVASHELRTPLASVRAYVQLLLQGRMGDLSERQRDALEVIDRNILRMARIISNVLDMAKIHHSELILNLGDMDLCEVISSVVQEVKPLASAKKIEISVQVSGPVMGKWDRDRIHQVLTNLLDNAIKFTMPEGRILVRASHAGDHVQVEVTDSGVGIKKERLESIFEPFGPVRGKDREPGTGLGLGLSISKGIVEAHGGKIWVESQEEKGSSFYFTLPLNS